MSDTPDNTAVRTALWRALHVQVDAPPHVLVDELGPELAGVDDSWRQRRDMDPQGTARSRSSIVVRARYIEDLVAERAADGVDQYVVLGAGLDTFAVRRPALMTHLHVFEVDQPGTQAWKRARLAELGTALPPSLHFVPVDFEAGDSWWDALVAAGFDPTRPAVVASTGVSLYLTNEANVALWRQLSALVPGSTVAMSFMLPNELLEPEEQPALAATAKFAAMAGTPFLSLLAPAAIVAMATEAGFTSVEHVSASALTERYFAGRTDGLRPSSAEELVVATV